MVVELLTNTNDSGAGSLRQTILDANAAGGGKINFSNLTDLMTPLSALPCLTNITIAGLGKNLLTVNGNDQFRVFCMSSGTTNTISDLTIANGRVTGWSMVVACGLPHGRFTSLARQANGRVQMQWSAVPGRLYLLEASTNLVDWERIGVAVDQGEGRFTFEDVDAARFRNRFYRVVAP